VTDAGSSWLGVPWHGRTAGQPVSETALEATSLAMLRANFGLKPEAAPSASRGLDRLPDDAWEAGLLALPSPGGPEWSLADVRLDLKLKRPIVAVLNAESLPGHLPADGVGEVPVVLIGSTGGGFIYNDPSFSSSLGYGLELAEGEFAQAWQSAAHPGRAWAFLPAPAPLPASAHVRQADLPAPIARVLPTPTPLPPPPRLTPVLAPAQVAPTVLPEDDGPRPSTPEPVAADAASRSTERVAQPASFDASGVVLAACLALVLAAVAVQATRRT
jgi:hypothetical protein